MCIDERAWDKCDVRLTLPDFIPYQRSQIFITQIHNAYIYNEVKLILITSSLLKIADVNIIASFGRPAAVS